jgi:class 3 adenylate cyclase
VEEGRYVASKIPGSRYVEFPGDDHLPFVGNQTEILDEIEAFVTGTQNAGQYDRVLATVMNVQIEGRDDAREGAFAFVRHQLEFFKGREITSDAHSLAAAFDGPVRAIRCAALIANVTGFEAKLRAGVHTGECDIVGDEYRGFAVDLATRIAMTADIASVLVSRTVKDLVAGSGIGFAEYGVESFDGLEGEWRLFRVVP